MTRRALLAAAGTTALASISGCTTTSVTDLPVDADVPTSTVGQTSDEPTETATETVTRTDADSFTAETVERARETGVAVRMSVVAMSRDPPEIQGTGWYFDSPGFIATAGHLLAVDEDWVAWQPDGTRLDPTYVDDAYLSGADVGAMESDESAPPLPAGDADALETGQPLVQVGNPGGVGNWVISLGRYLGETDGEADGFRSSVPARGGSSGSPTLTLDGEVVGLLSGAEFVDRTVDAMATDETPVYGPDDDVIRSEHVGIGAVTDWVAEWTDE